MSGKRLVEHVVERIGERETLEAYEVLVRGSGRPSHYDPVTQGNVRIAGRGGQRSGYEWLNFRLSAARLLPRLDQEVKLKRIDGPALVYI